MPGVEAACLGGTLANMLIRTVSLMPALCRLPICLLDSGTLRGVIGGLMMRGKDAIALRQGS